MNYIKLINAFWQMRRERSDFDPYVIALYFALVDIANRRDWKPFTAYREDVVTLAGMSAKPYYKARTILKEAGLIDYKEGSSKTTMCSFTINQLLPTVTEATTEGQQFGNGSDYGTETEATTILNKQLNLETTKHLNNSLGADAPETEPEKESEDQPKEKEKKASHTGGAARPKKQAFFEAYPTYPDFSAAWASMLTAYTGKYQQVYADADMEHYYEVVGNHAFKNKPDDWIKTMQNWLIRAKTEYGNLKTKIENYDPGKQQNKFQQPKQIPSLKDHSYEELLEKYTLKRA